MKKLILCLMAVFTFLLFIPTNLNAETVNSTTTSKSPSVAKSSDANAMVVRLNEIKAMDKSNMSKPEKKELRTEERALRSDLNANSEATSNDGTGGGLYISVGAAILIVLLLILIL